MSNPEPDPVEPIGPDYVTFGLDGYSTMAAWDQAQVFADPDIGIPFDQAVTNAKAQILRLQTTAVVEDFDAVWDFVQGAVDDGTLTVAEVPDFLGYVRFNLATPAITAAMVAAGFMAGAFLKYKESLGYFYNPSPLPGNPSQPAPVSPPAPAPAPIPIPTPPVAPIIPAPVPVPPVPVQPSPPVLSPPVVIPPSPSPPLPSPPAPVTVGQPQTTGQKVVVSAATGLVNQTVTAPGLTPAEAKAISTAIGISVVDVYKVVAQVIDLMLPNLAPGQVPAALGDLFSAVTVLEHQLDPIVQGIRDHGGMATGEQVTYLSEAVQGLVAELGTVISQLDEQAASALQTDLDATKTQVAANTTAITGIEQVLPTLATTTALQGVQTEVTTTVEQLGATAPSVLGNELASTTAIAQDALRIAEDAETCCAAQTENLTNDENALGGKSNLPNLGKIAGWIFGLGFVAGLLDVVVAVFDLPAAFSGTVTDVETLSGWADAAANQVIADTSWSNMVAAA